MATKPGKIVTYFEESGPWGYMSLNWLCEKWCMTTLKSANFKEDFENVNN